MSRTDEPRLLHRRSEYGYTRSSAEALPGEPEAVDAKTQRHISLAARRTQEQRQREAWASAHRQISGALQTFQASGPDRRVLDAARAVERAAARVTRML